MIDRYLKSLALMLLLGFSAQPASADTLLIDSVAKNASVERPVRGESMNSVQNRYGTANSVRRAVGDPPITRWEYPAFTVYFEHSHVIHAVVN